MIDGPIMVLFIYFLTNDELSIMIMILLWTLQPQPADGAVGLPVCSVVTGGPAGLKQQTWFKYIICITITQIYGSIILPVKMFFPLN